VEDEYVTVRRSKLQELRQAMDEYRLVVEKLRKDLEKIKRFRQEG
jgi:uncharacterized membrane protein (DUF106 family)